MLIINKHKAMLQLRQFAIFLGHLFAAVVVAIASELHFAFMPSLVTHVCCRLVAVD